MSWMLVIFSLTVQTPFGGSNLKVTESGWAAEVAPEAGGAGEGTVGATVSADPMPAASQSATPSWSIWHVKGDRKLCVVNRSSSPRERRRYRGAHSQGNPGVTGS